MSCENAQTWTPQMVLPLFLINTRLLPQLFAHASADLGWQWLETVCCGTGGRGRCSRLEC